MGIEIEKKFLVKELPKDLDKYPCHIIEQGYLNVSPAIRVRREDDSFYMTYKGKKGEDGTIGQTEYNLSLDEESYLHLSAKADGNIIRKKRYLLPINDDAFDEENVAGDADLAEALREKSIIIELDVFEAPFEGRVLAEVEFPSEGAAKAYRSAEWFLKDVTGDYHYSNAYMSTEIL